MAVLLHVDRPSVFLEAIYHQISVRAIDTWSYDLEGDFTHSPAQWAYRAWFSPIVLKSSIDGIYNICFGIVPSIHFPLDASLYGLYHGRFAEMLIVHFPDKISKLELTSKSDPRIDFV